MKIVADENIPFVEQCFSSIGVVETLSGRQMTSAVTADADVLVVRSITSVGAELLAASRVRFVGTATIGFDHIDIDYLRENGIGFASAPGSNANSAAEYVVAGLLEVAAARGVQLEGKSIGIIGVGNVGSRVAEKCTALGMEVKLNDPPLQRQTGDAKYVPIEDLYNCDVLTLHTPLTYDGPDRTFHLGDERFFRSLKKGCVFVNASRGAVVDSEALKRVIRTGESGGVVLDVWEAEPGIDVELLKMVDIGTPHIAGYSLDGKVAGMMMIYRAVCEHFGIKPKYDVADFLPEPAVAELEIQLQNEQQAVLEAVRGVYDIREDDHRLKEILQVEAGDRGAFFDRLRREYPVRREWQNTRVIVKGGGDGPAKKLKGIGFGKV